MTTTDDQQALPAPNVQIAVDCADPHRLVRFWAAATGSQIEDHHDLVEQMLAAGFERLVELGATSLWEASQGPHSWVTLADPEGNEFCVA